MDINFTLTIIFGVITLFGVFLGWKALFRPKINFFSEDVTTIANIGKVSEDLSVSFKNEPVSNDLVLISAYIVNVGNVDISNADVEQHVTLVLPLDASWLSFQIEKNKHNMIINEEIKNNELILKTGLWKKSEGFKFDALICINDDAILKDKNKIFNILKINSRIKGLGEISIKKLPQVKEYKSKFGYLISFVPILVMILYILLGVTMYKGVGKQDTYSFLITDQNNNIVELVSKDGIPSVVGKNGFIHQANSKGFYNLNLRTVKNGVHKGDKQLGLFTILMGIIGLIVFNIKHVKNYILRRRIEKS